MSNTNQIKKTNQVPFSPWMAFGFAILTSIFVDAVILWGLAEMSSAFKIAVISGVMAIFAFSISFSFLEISKINEKSSLKVHLDKSEQ